MMGNLSSPLGTWARSHIGTSTLICLSVALAGVYLVTQYSVVLLGMLPWAVILLCPLMHLFMHRGHSGHGQGEGRGGHEGHEVRVGGHGMKPDREESSAETGSRA